MNWSNFSDPPHHEWYSKGQSKESLKASDKEDVDHSNESGGTPTGGTENSSGNGGTAVSEGGKLSLKHGLMGGWYDSDGNTVDLEGAMAKMMDKRYGVQATGGGTAATGGNAVISGDCPWMEIAKKEVGTSESKNMARIKQYCKEGAGSGYNMWCAAFVSWCLKQAGAKITGSMSSQFPTMSPGTNEFTKLDKPQYGAIIVLRKVSKNTGSTGSNTGHITFFVKDNGNGTFSGLGGNQGNTVKESNYSLTVGGGFKYIGAYWPKEIGGNKISSSGAKAKDTKKGGTAGQGSGHYDAGSDASTAYNGMSYPEALAKAERESGESIFRDNDYNPKPFSSVSGYNSIFGISDKKPTISNSYNPSLSMVNNSGLKASPLGNKGLFTNGIGFAGNNNVLSSNNISMEGILLKNNKLMEQLLNENRLLRGLSEQQLDMQTWTAISNDEISKKRFSSDITNVYTGQETDKAEQFTELTATLNKWKGEKIDINYEAEFAAESEKAKSSTASTTTKKKRATKAKASAKKYAKRKR